MKTRIAVYGGRFNPPGTHHRQVVKALLEHFDHVIVVPCGPRPDKDVTQDTEPVHRASLVDMCFRDLPVEIDLFDLEQAAFTRTYDIDQRYRERGEVWHAVGTDLLQGGAEGKSPIQRYWYRGAELWRDLNFAVIGRPGYAVDKADLPPNHLFIESDDPGSSSTTRERLFRHESITDLVQPEVERYIARYRLYRSGLPQRATRLHPEHLHPCVLVDRDNPRALQIAQRFEGHSVELDDRQNPPDCIVVIGGDGMMLHAIREHWRRRLPMVGISAGHRGFLLNRVDNLNLPALRQDFIVQHLPLLYVDILQLDGTWQTSFAFNDAWVERASAQTSWIEVRVDDAIRIPKLVSDGILLATAAGSTAYARAMGATPMRVDTPELLLVGSNVMEPHRWKSAQLSLESVVEFHNLGEDKRPLNGYVDGVAVGSIQTMRIRKSRIAAVELAFTPERDLTAKLTEIQFPQ